MLSPDGIYNIIISLNGTTPRAPLAVLTNRGPQNSDKKEVEKSGTKLGFNQRTAKTMQLYERETDGFLLLGGSSAQTSGEQATRISTPGGV